MNRWYLSVIIWILFTLKIYFILNPNPIQEQVGLDSIAWGLLLIWSAELLASQEAKK